VWFAPTASVGTIGLAAKSPPPASTKTAPQVEPCKPGGLSVIGTQAADYLKDYQEGQIICAKGGDDVIEVRYAKTTVWAGSGNDTIRARNSVPNEVQGGPDRDTGTLDSRSIDTWYADSAPRTTSSVRQGAVVYPALEPRVQCTVVNGQRRLLFDPTPNMRAADVTSQVDWEYVAWSGVLSWWNATTQKWEYVAQTEWLWDRTYDKQVAAFPGNDWRRFTNNQEKYSVWFYANQPGYFRVAVIYYHYGFGTTPSNRVYDWVDEHVGPYASQSGPWCEFA
jgi:hypothetical protein